MSTNTLSTRRQTLLVAAVVIAVSSVLGFSVSIPAATAAAGDIGYVGSSFTGTVNSPTADKAESKLWFNDGLWWANMFDSASQTWHIFRLNRATETWTDTGTRVDDRPETSSDVLWDGAHLYVATHWVTESTDSSVKVSLSGKPSRLYRYSYQASTKTYTLDSNFPVVINNYSSESLTIDKDSTGTVWATWTQVAGTKKQNYTNTVYVNSTRNSDDVWGSPTPLPVSGASAAPDDISAIVAFARNKIGVLWSNHLDDTLYWAVHNDGDSISTWRGSVAVRGNKQADDHLNVKTIQSDTQGRVYAAVKTSLDQLSGASSTSPQVNLMVFKPGTGSWSTYTFGTIADCHTRPIVMLDETNSEVHMFATAPTASGCSFAGAPGTIYEKVAPMGNPVFAPGRGTPVIRDAASANINNATSMKQSVNSQTGLVVLASNTATSRYWHADLTIRGASAAPTASFTASPTSGTAPLSVQFTDTSSGSPTSWSWDFGNGDTSTQQNPSTTYTTAGTYTVTLTASDTSGSTSTATTTLTVSPAAPVGILRAGSSTSIMTTADTALTIPKPAGTSSGDLLVSCLALNGSGVANGGVPTGWQPIAAVTGISNPRVYGYYKVAGSSEPDSYRWGFSSSITSGGGIARYTGAAGLDTAASKATGASATSATVPGVTTLSNNAMLVGCVGINSGSTSVVITGPAGMSEAWDIGGKRNELDDALQGSAGPSGDKTWLLSSGREWAGWLAALRPL